jgi:hypothetical protein
MEIRIVLDRPKGEALLEQVPTSLVPAIEALRVAPVQMMHPAREIVQFALDNNVEVIRHEAIRVERPRKALDGSLEERDPGDAIGVVTGDRHPIDAARVRVEEPVLRKGRARSARHAATVRPGGCRNWTFFEPCLRDCPLDVAITFKSEGLSLGLV